MPMTRLILIDRDGVINHDSPDYIKTPDEWLPIPGSLEAVVTLKRAGYKVAVCTNQAGVGRGLIEPEALTAIHQKMMDALARCGTRLDGLIFCPHHPDDQCSCRKPKPGMLLAMMAQLNAEAEDTWYVGDSIKDAEAAAQAGCRFALVRTGNGRATESKLHDRGPYLIFDDLSAFAASIGTSDPCCLP